jgi:hypothetical protein
MANALYPKWKEAIAQASSDSALSGTVKVVLVDTGTYTYNSAHQFLSSLSGTGGTSQTLGSKTYKNGVFDAADVTFAAVAGTVTYEALVIYIDTGSSATSRLVAYIDTGVTGLPITSNGGDIVIGWNASGIFAL